MSIMLGHSSMSADIKSEEYGDKLKKKIAAAKIVMDMSQQQSGTQFEVFIPRKVVGTIDPSKFCEVIEEAQENILPSLGRNVVIKELEVRGAIKIQPDHLFPSLGVSVSGLVIRHNRKQRK